MWEALDYPTPIPSFRQPVPVPGVEPDDGPCFCVQFAPAWQPYILGALDQLSNPATWDTSDPDTLQTTLYQVARLREMFGATSGCSTPPPAPPVTPTDDIDCKIASYLIRTVTKEILQAAINIVFPPSQGLSLLEYILDAIPGVGDFIGLFGYTAKSLSTTIAGAVALPWVETAAEDTVWDAIGCKVYDGVKGVHAITDDILGPIQSAIESLDIAFPEFLQAVSKILGDLGSDVLTLASEMATATDFDCAACMDATPAISGTDPQTYVARPLEVEQGATDVTQVRRLTFSTGSLVLDSGTKDKVTYTPPGLTVSDGVHSVDDATSLTVSGMVVSGDTPDATIALDASTQPIPAPGGAPALSLVSTAAQGKVLAPGAVPANWYGYDYDDSAWPAALQNSSEAGAPLAGTEWISYTTSADLPGGEIWEHRVHFTVANALLAHAQLTLYADNTVQAVYLNGNAVPCDTVDENQSIALRLTLLAEGDNVLALQIMNVVADSPNPTSVSYRLDVWEYGLQGATGAQGAQGPQGPQGPPGSSGGGGGMALIAKVAATADPAIVVDDIPAGYAALVVMWQGRSTYNGDEDDVSIQFNGSDAGYFWIEGDASTSAFGGQGATGTTAARIGVAPAANQTAAMTASGTLTLPGYDSSTHSKNGYGNSVRPSIPEALIEGVGWGGTSPVVSLSVFLANANWASGSYVAVYGLPAS